MKRLVTLVLSAIILFACAPKAEKKDDKTAKKETIRDIISNANIYEVNIRQYTKEGTFNAFAKHLPRLKELGVDILWLMPIYPVGQKNKKGDMGSPYAVKDYRTVNPDYGTMQDFKNLVNKIHEMGMYVILDWVANHTAWDNKMIEEHPEWYTQKDGKIIMPVGTDWSDVADLNYDNKELRKYMTGSFDFWLKKTNIDGFRCDVAGMVPTDFWNDAVTELKKTNKPFFMLAEAWEPALLEKAFDMCYGWDMHHLMNDIAKGKKTVADLDKYKAKLDTMYTKEDIVMNFITNHDENTWNGTITERMGDAGKAFAVFTYTFPGMPLIYSGQEVGNNKRIKFFYKDEIDWNNPKKSELTPFYTKLNKFKTNNSAVANGKFGGDIIRIQNSENSKVYSFVREVKGNKVFTIINMSKELLDVTFKGEKQLDEYKELFRGNKVKIEPNTKLKIEPWGYNVFVK